MEKDPLFGQDVVDLLQILGIRCQKVKLAAGQGFAILQLFLRLAWPNNLCIGKPLDCVGQGESVSSATKEFLTLSLKNSSEPNLGRTIHWTVPRSASHSAISSWIFTGANSISPPEFRRTTMVLRVHAGSLKISSVDTSPFTAFSDHSFAVIISASATLGYKMV